MIKRIICPALLLCLILNTSQPFSVFAFSSSIGLAVVAPTWNINAVKAPEFWSKTNYRGEGVVVAILDNGVNYTLPDLDGNYLGGHDYVDNDDDPMPDAADFHGTACASIAIGEGDQTYIGVAPRAKYYALRTGEGSIWNLTYAANAIYWALDPNHRADVISLSGAYFPESSVWPPELSYLWSACKAAWQCGVVVVSSTCNLYKNYPIYPARFGYVIAVGAYTQSGQIPSFSNSGCDLVAPGENVPALKNDGTEFTFTGTSAAAPHVAGAVALLLSRYGKWATGKYQPDEVRQILKLSAKPLSGYSSWDQGAGLLNCLDIINYRAYLSNAGFEGDPYYYYSWNNTEPFEGEANIFENRYWWNPPPWPEGECQPGIDYFDSLEGDLHLNLSLTSNTPGQNVYTGVIQPADWFNLKAYGASKTIRELHVALRTLEITVGTTCQKARIAIKISFNSTQTKHIYYCWYAKGSDTNTTNTCYYNMGTVTPQKQIITTRNIKQDFYNAFNTQLTRSWKITSVTCEITITQTSNYDHIGLLAGEISLYGNYTNKITGDINWDGVVDIKDLVLLIGAFGTCPGHPSGKWNPNADLNSDRKVDIKDLVLLQKYYGEID